MLAFCALALFAKPISHSGITGPLGSVVPRSAAPDATIADAFLDLPETEAQFDTTAAPLPPNVASLGFQSAATSEFGDLVRLEGETHFLESVTVTMSSWAIHSDFPDSSPLGFTHPITLNLYAVDRSAGTPKPGAVLATVTTRFLIPWRPEPDFSGPSSPDRYWRADDGRYYTGLAFNLTFQLGALAHSLPDEVIVGISFNTQNYGVAPTNTTGPYNFLHVGVSDRLPTVGADLESDAAFWKTANAGDYTDRGTAGVNQFRRDTGWAPYRPAVRFNNSPYGTLASAEARIHSLTSTDLNLSASIAETGALTQWALTRSLWDGNNRLQRVWGRLVFDLLAEAADDLSRVADSRDASAVPADAAIETLVSVSESLAEVAVADAVIAGVNGSRIARAQDALEAAYNYAARERYDKAIDAFGNAWREAQLALR